MPTYTPSADLTPTKTNASGVGLGSAFILASRTPTSAVALAAGLQVSPALEFAAEPSATASTVRIVPKAPLAAGTTYRFALTDPSGSLIGTWAYQTEHPIHVVGLVPNDHATGVPVNTGIEITFDQDGVADLPAHFSIEPTVAGTFEPHGRTIVFVPSRALATATVYHVSISAGVTMTGSTQTLERPVTFAFETGGTAAKGAWDVGLGRPVLEASPREPAIIGVDIWADNDADLPRAIPLQVYQLPSFAAARSAAAKLVTTDDWAAYGSADLIATDGLAKVVDAQVTPEAQTQMGYRVIRLPKPLAAGWYLVVVPRDGRDRQALLQVTDLAAWAMTSETRTLAWVHDLATGAAIGGAELVDPTGATIATTTSDGLVDIATPPTLIPAMIDAWGSRPTIATLVAPDGRRLLLVLGEGSRSGAYAWERNAGPSTTDAWQHYWLLVSTDRSTYRPTDTVHAWGVIRSRADASVPASVEIRIRTQDASETSGPWLVRATVKPTVRGTWAGDLSIAGLPYGSYVVDVLAGGSVATSTWISIQDIRKPAYRIDVTTDHGVVYDGDPVAVRAQAVYFDGTSAPGLRLRAEGFGSSATATGDATGTATYGMTARVEGRSGYTMATIGLAPADPEEGQISGSANVVVFPSAAWLEASSVIAGTRIQLAGRATHVDVAAVERQLAENGWPEDPAGAAWAGLAITVRVVEQIPVSRQVGTTYDFIEKRSVPVMEYTITEHATGTYTTTSGADGVIGLSIGIPNADHTYKVTLTARDAMGRLIVLEGWAYPAGPGAAGQATVTAPYLDQAQTCGYDAKYLDVGQSIPLTMYGGDGTPSTGEHLFIVAAGGVREAVLQASPTFTRTFDAADMPSVEVLAVRFGAGGYVVTNEVQLRIKPDGRALTVSLTPDRARYAPGQTATVAVQTTGPDGAPVAADVVIRGVDEKLFAIGGATDVDALASLLQPTNDGILQTVATHPLPAGIQGGCGDTTGGGRDDFRDSIVFRLISTGADGRGTASIPLPDDITSWHISASAVDDQLRAGDGAVLLPVGLPFFADAILAPEFVVGDHPVLRLRGAGDSLTAGDRVRFTVSAPTLLLPATTVEADGFAIASVALPELPLGTHAITITADVVGHAGLHDQLVRSVIVRSSRLEVAQAVAVDAASAATVGGPGLTTYVITDAGRGALLPSLWNLSTGGGARFDRALAADLARTILRTDFAADPASLPASGLDISAWENGGIALLPYSSVDLELSALAAIVAPEALDHDSVNGLFTTTIGDPGSTRERRIVALAGQAGLGLDVLDALRLLDIPGLQPRESLWLALGFVASGDENAARTIERSLLTRYGQELGPWVRLQIGTTVATPAEATAMLALVAAGIGDPIAGKALAYVRDNPSSTFLPALHEIGAIRWLLERLPRAAATFAWTVDGVRHVETLDPGATRSLVVSASQRTGLAIQPLSGQIALVASWTGAPTAGDLPGGELVTITRTVSPVGTADAAGVVRVTLKVDFSAQAPVGCWDVRDVTPSGLAPVAWAPGWQDEQRSTTSKVWPFDVSGQRISWCVDPHDSLHQTLAYAARVVSPGTYTWEPAVVQLAVAPDSGAATSAQSYTIR